MHHDRSSPGLTLARYPDVTRVLGVTDEAIAAEILCLQPTVADLEAASLWLMGDDDVVPAEVAPDSGVTARIVCLLTAKDAQRTAPPVH